MSRKKAPKIAVLASAGLVLGGCSASSETTPPPEPTAEAAPTCTGEIAQLNVDKAWYYYIGKITGGSCVTMQFDRVPGNPPSIDLHVNDGLNGGCIIVGDHPRLQTNYEQGDLRYGGSVPITSEAAAAARPPLPYCPVMPTEPSVVV